MESDNKVIQLKPKDPNARRLKPKVEKSYCNHYCVVVDKHERSVECETCGAILDAFDFLLRTAHEENNHFSAIPWAKRELEDLRKQKEDLIREVNNLKAQRRRLI